MSKEVRKVHLLEYYMLKNDEDKEKALKEKKKNHKCNSCVWGSWAGNKFVCVFTHCVKENGLK